MIDTGPLLGLCAVDRLLFRSAKSWIVGWGADGDIFASSNGTAATVCSLPNFLLPEPEPSS
jgi:hypothetical protein